MCILIVVEVLSRNMKKNIMLGCQKAGNIALPGGGMTTASAIEAIEWGTPDIADPGSGAVATTSPEGVVVVVAVAATLADTAKAYLVARSASEEAGATIPTGR